LFSIIEKPGKFVPLDLALLPGADKSLCQSILVGVPKEEDADLTSDVLPLLRVRGEPAQEQERAFDSFLAQHRQHPLARVLLLGFEKLIANRLVCFAEFREGLGG